MIAADRILARRSLDEFYGQRGRFQFSFGTGEASRTSIIKHLIKHNDYQTYLEIGVRDRSNFEQIQIKEKTSVDPNPLAEVDYKMTSDDFFNKIQKDRKFDIVFIDGLHLYEQVRKDIQNALAHLSENGTIVMHDCNPPTAFHQRENYEVNGEFPSWNGTVWKAWVELRCTAANLSMTVVNTDWGVGVIQRGAQTLYPSNAEDIQYAHLDSDRKAILNLVSVEEFLRIDPPIPLDSHLG